MTLSVIILAAGQGTRMRSNKPKVLHEIGGVPMLAHVINAAQQLSPDKIHVVYGVKGEQVQAAMADFDVNWVHQAEQLGTGHAVSQAIPFCEGTDQTLVLYGDVPLISPTTLQQLLTATEQGLGLVVVDVADPAGFGRIVRDEQAAIKAIVEHKDADDATLQIKEVNTGILAAGTQQLKKWLAALDNNNAQQEYYLTDVVAKAVADGVAVAGVSSAFVEEVQGVNDRWQQANLERYFQLQQAKALATQGVRMMDPARFDMRAANVSVGMDVVIDINVVLEGQITLGSGVTIGANVQLKNVTLGDHVTVLPNSVLDGVDVASDATIGPFARLRPGTVLAEGAKIGNFVEVKNTYVGPGSKASHLTYLGDANLGKGVNIGAGTITCNYDGKQKHRTDIGDGAFVGSNTALVAPVVLGQHSLIGAGSVITKDVADHALAIARAKQLSVAKKLES